MRSDHNSIVHRAAFSCAVALCAFALPGMAGASALRAQSDASTYLDANARALVQGAMARRTTVDRSISEYRTTSTERMSMGHRALGRDRLLYRRETASHVHWTRTGLIEIEVVGAREVVPVAVPTPQIPNDLKNFMPHIAFDPMDAEFLIRFDTTAIIHPFSETGLQNYQFRTGDSSSITLPSGRRVRLVELEFIPRRIDPHLIAGSFWLDRDTHATVQAAFRLARQFEFNRDTDKEDRPPGWVPAMSMDLSYLAVDYGLYELHWWLPRYVVAEGVARLGPFGTIPMKYERTYSDYEVKGDTMAMRVARDTTVLPSCRAPMEVNVSVRTGDDAKTPPDTAEIRQRDDARAARQKARRDSIAAKSGTPAKENAKPTCVPREFKITQLSDSMLMHSEYLPGTIYGGDKLLSQAELDEISERVNDLPHLPWVLARPRLAIGTGGPGLIRYNRIEALSIGARGELDLGQAAATGELRFGTADRELSAELGLQRETSARSWRIGGYHRLTSTDPALKPFSLTSSLSALLFGIDDAKYFRATGAELTVSPAIARAQWYSLRLYHERQQDVDRNTNISLRHLLNSDYVFSENIDAARATQSGADLTLRAGFGNNPDRLRAGAEIGARGETGTFDFVRPTATIRLSAPVLGFAAAIEGAAGTSTGDVPAQSMWYLGGVTTLRGYVAGARSGDSFWRGRVEVATKLPIARLALFSDMGWAGSRKDFSASRPLLSVGAGFSALDGIVRVDIAHALRESKDWRLYLYTGAIL